MNWGTFAVQRLRDYEKRLDALENIPEQIKTLEMQLTAIRSATTDGEAVKGGGNQREDMLIYNISKRGELKNNLEIVRRQVKVTENGLAALDDEERKILHLFFINRPKDYIDRLCADLYIGKSELYRRKDAALRKFTIAVYGLSDL